MILESAKATIEMVFHVVSIFAAVVALWTYRRNARTRHAEWLLSLHQKFYESDRYQRIRRTLDYKAEPEFSDLVERLKSETASDDVDHLYEYMNLFEFVAK